MFNNSKMAATHLILIFISCLYLVCANYQNEAEENIKIFNETVARFGPPINHWDLPGPELVAGEDILSYNDIINKTKNTNYTLRIRTIAEGFSYNGRFEVGEFNKTKNCFRVKGQFGEHFVKKTGGFYIRTIGYVLDDTGYEQFLIDLSVAMPFVDMSDISHRISAVGEPQEKFGISSTVLASLTGGNIG